MENLKDIDTSTKEGKLCIALLGHISSKPPYEKRTIDDIIRKFWSKAEWIHKIGKYAERPDEESKDPMGLKKEAPEAVEK